MNAKIRNAIKLPVTNPVPSPLTSSDISDLRRAENEGGVRWVPQRPDTCRMAFCSSAGLASGGIAGLGAGQSHNEQRAAVFLQRWFVTLERGV
jgi:hypothetical protein